MPIDGANRCATTTLVVQSGISQENQALRDGEAGSCSEHYIGGFGDVHEVRGFFAPRVACV